ncbi:hypothetical protein WA556_002242 [Blastocystis sp. ATCC 50177/Nand II]
MDSKSPVSTFYTLAASPMLSILCFFVILRDPSLAEIWSQEVRPYDPFPANVNALFLREELNTHCRNAILSLASNIYYCLRTPSRIPTSVSVQFRNTPSSVDFLLPYVRCSSELPMEDYLQAKYLNCSSTEVIPKSASLQDFLPEEKELCSQWTRGGGTILLATEAKGLKLQPDDIVMNLENEGDLSFFVQSLRRCQSSSSCLSRPFSSSSPSGFSASVRFLFVTHPSSLHKTVSFILHSFPAILPNCVLLHFPFNFSSSSITSFTNLAYSISPSLSNPTTPQLFFNIVQYTQPLDFDLFFEISPHSSTLSWQFASLHNTPFLCVWRPQITDEAAFRQKMILLNQFYTDLHTHHITCYPPLATVFSGVLLDSACYDLFLLGPIPQPQRIAPFDETAATPVHLTQLLHAFDLLWSLGYELNSYEVLLCNNNAFFYDVTLLQRTNDIPAGMLDEAREQARSSISQFFSAVTPDGNAGEVDLEMPITAGTDNSWELGDGVCVRVPSPVGSGLSEAVVVSEFALEKWFVRCEEAKWEVESEVKTEGVKEEEVKPKQVNPEEVKPKQVKEEEKPERAKEEEEKPNTTNAEDDDDDYTYSYYEYSCDEYYSDVSEETEEKPTQPTEISSISVNPQAIDDLFKPAPKPTPAKTPEIGSSLDECRVEEKEELEYEKSNRQEFDRTVSLPPVLESTIVPPTDAETSFRIVYHGEEDESIRDHIAELAVRVGLEYAIRIMDGGRNIRESIETTKGGNGNDDMEMLPEDEYELDVRHDLYDMGCAKDE